MQVKRATVYLQFPRPLPGPAQPARPPEAVAVRIGPLPLYALVHPACAAARGAVVAHALAQVADADVCCACRGLLNPARRN
jgi:hypothetical protein